MTPDTLPYKRKSLPKAKPEIHAKATVEDAIQYAEKVASGEILACIDVINQCKIFLHDFKVRQHQTDFRWRFDYDKANHIITFVQLLRFVEGTVAGSPVRLADWQAYIFANSHGWVDKIDDEIRRYTRIICQVARKNSKSTLTATLAIWELMYAPEGSQIAGIATTENQARILWGMSRRMIQRSDPRLTNYPDTTSTTTNTILNDLLWNRYSPFSKSADSLDGLNIRLAICDESARIKDREQFEVLESSMGSQKSPQTWHLTTAQAGAESNYYFEELSYAKKVLAGLVEDDRIFCLAYALDPDDEWDDDTKWIKANPNLGKSASLEFLKERCAEAKQVPSKKAEFFTKYLNRFISTSQSWIELEKWNENTVDELRTDLPMYLGLDLGSTDDLTAVSQVWAEDGEFYFTAKCFIPEAAFKSVPKHVRAVYDAGVANGTLIVTEGEIADHTAIRDHILSLKTQFDLREVAFDTYSAAQLTSQLQEAGLNMVKFGQNMSSMSPAAKDAEMMIRTKKFKHLDDPFLAWQLSNCETYRDVNENIKVRKGADRALKIDAIIAMIMAIGRATAHGAQHKKKVFDFYFA